MAVPVPVARDSAPSAAWPLWQRVGFRFTLTYAALYLYPFPLGWDGIPYTDEVGAYLWKAVEWITTWFARYGLGMRTPVLPAENGSGDTTFDYVSICWRLLAAVVVALVWSAFARERREHPALHAWLRVGLRYYLAMVMLVYGFYKLWPNQFPAPHIGRLVGPLGDASPMGILWTFMGASPTYTSFAGLLEIACGVCLVFRRTTTLGALLSLGVLGNVVMLNLCYDVPVKLFSMHLWLVAAFLAAPDARRLVRVFVYNQSVAPADLAAPRLPWRPRWHIIGKVTCLLALMTVHGVQASDRYHTTGNGAPKQARFGLYEVTSFTRSGVALAPGDPKRWQKFAITERARAGYLDGEGHYQAFTLAQDEQKHTFKLEKFAPDPLTILLSFAEPSRGQLVLSGEVDGARIQVGLSKLPDPEFLLRTRGFHWINEFPFNR